MINHILFVQPIFAPDEKRAERNINSIQSFGEYVKQNGNDGINLSISFGGWAKTDELWNKIVDACHQHISPDLNPVRFDKNYGKAHVVNNLVDGALKQQPSINAILTADSDILFPLETQNMFIRLVIAAQQMVTIKKQNWGMISLNQLGQCCHWKVCYDNQAKYIATIKNQQYPELMVWPTEPSGIAGGCLFLNKEYWWDKLKGYPNNSLYGPDDALTLLYCKHHGYSWQMADTIGIIHPEENDQLYAEWKVRICQQAARNQAGDLNDQIRDADNFWATRQ